MSNCFGSCEKLHIPVFFFIVAILVTFSGCQLAKVDPKKEEGVTISTFVKSVANGEFATATSCLCTPSSSDKKILQENYLVQLHNDIKNGGGIGKYGFTYPEKVIGVREWRVDLVFQNGATCSIKICTEGLIYGGKLNLIVPPSAVNSSASTLNVIPGVNSKTP